MKQQLRKLTDEKTPFDPYEIGRARGWLAAIDYLRDLPRVKMDQEEARERIEAGP